MLKIGITGGIGSGKSTMAAIFEVLGIPVYYADDAAKRIMNEDKLLKEAIQNHFGKEAYSNALLNREYLAQKVFNNEQKLSLLNSVVHPAVIEDARNWMQKQTSSYIIKEAALLFESGSDKDLDFVIGISAPPELRIQRAMSRNSITKEQVLSRMNKQMDEEKKLALCDYIIVNDEKRLLLPQILTLHQTLLNISNQKIPVTPVQ